MKRLLWLAVAFVAACSSPTPAGAPATFCQDGQAVCKGNAVATCKAGTSYDVTPCGESKYCTGGTCKPVVCEKGKLSCDGKNVMACPEDGSADPSVLKTCPNKCLAGTCVGNCNDGETMCGWKSLLMCMSGNWSAQACGAGQICDAKQKKCIDRACTPTDQQCTSASARQICSITGDKWQPASCGAGEGCFDGVCRTLVKGGEKPDAGTTVKDVATSGGDATVNLDTKGFIDIGKKEIILEQNDLFTVTLSETATPPAGTAPMTFDFSSANYNSISKMLQISGDSGLNKLEIQIAPIEEFQTGTFTAAGGEAADAKVLMNDGTTDPAKVQWKYQQADYTINLTAFDDVGGRIQGTFSAQLIDATDKTKKLYLVDGSFDIKRSN